MGCECISRPIDRISPITSPCTRPSVTSTAVSIIDSVKLLMPKP